MKRLSVNFRLKKKTRSSTAIIYLRINIGGNRDTIYLNKQIKKDNWNKVSQKPKGLTKEDQQLSSFLDDVKFRILQIHRELILENAEITTEAVKDRYLGIENKKSTI